MLLETKDSYRNEHENLGSTESYESSVICRAAYGPQAPLLAELDY